MENNTTTLRHVILQFRPCHFCGADNPVSARVCLHCQQKQMPSTGWVTQSLRLPPFVENVVVAPTVPFDKNIVVPPTAPFENDADLADCILELD